MADLTIDPDNQAGGLPPHRLREVAPGVYAPEMVVASPLNGAGGVPALIATFDHLVQRGRDLLATGATADLDVSMVRELHVFANVTSLTGGVTPSVAFVFERLELPAVGATPAVYRELFAPAALTGAGSIGRSIGPGLESARSLGRFVRLRWTISGGPTAAVADIAVIGKS